MDTRRRDILNGYAARTNMSAREYEILEKLIARANPPPVLYRYRRANDFTLTELTKRQIFAATPDDMNDPFEYYAPVSFDHAAFRRQFIEEFAPTRGISEDQAAKEFDAFPPESLTTTLSAGMERLRKDSGIICLSAVPDSIRMWSYYADAHKGICIGFDTEAGPFLAAMKVTYQNPERPLDVAAALREDPTQLAGHISLRKAAEWDFEQEYRIPVGPIGD